MEALADGQICPSRWWKLGSYHRHFWGFNFFGGIYLKVALRTVSGPGPAWLPGLFNYYDHLFQYHHRHNETTHLTADRTAATSAAPAPGAATEAFSRASNVLQQRAPLINALGSCPLAE